MLFSSKLLLRRSQSQSCSSRIQAIIFPLHPLAWINAYTLIPRTSHTPLVCFFVRYHDQIRWRQQGWNGGGGYTRCHICCHGNLDCYEGYHCRRHSRHRWRWWRIMSKINIIDCGKFGSKFSCLVILTSWCAKNTSESKQCCETMRRRRVEIVPPK